MFAVWLAGLSNKSTRCFDIYFAQGVGGLNKGTGVTFSGVPVGKIEKISLAARTARIRLGANQRR